MSGFYKYFKENMEALGLAAQRAFSVRSKLPLGPQPLFSARSTSMVLVIGSIAVATGRSVAGGTTIADVLFVATSHDLNRAWLLP